MPRILHLFSSRVDVVSRRCPMCRSERQQTTVRQIDPSAPSGDTTKPSVRDETTPEIVLQRLVAPSRIPSSCSVERGYNNSWPGSHNSLLQKASAKAGGSDPTARMNSGSVDRKEKRVREERVTSPSKKNDHSTQEQEAKTWPNAHASHTYERRLMCLRS